MGLDSDILYGLIAGAVLMLIIVITTTVIVGKKRNWGGGKIFGLTLVGIFFFPIWLFLIILLPADHPIDEPDFSKGETHSEHYRQDPAFSKREYREGGAEELHHHLYRAGMLTPERDSDSSDEEDNSMTSLHQHLNRAGALTPEDE